MENNSPARGDAYAATAHSATANRRVGSPLNAPALSAADRCDACGARAWVKVAMGSGELLFCAHHANRFEAKLQTQGQIVTDMRDELNSPTAYRSVSS